VRFAPSHRVTDFDCHALLVLVVGRFVDEEPVGLYVTLARIEAFASQPGNGNGKASNYGRYNGEATLS
jgi:hypothetical protein